MSILNLSIYDRAKGIFGCSEQEAQMLHQTHIEQQNGFDVSQHKIAFNLRYSGLSKSEQIISASTNEEFGHLTNPHLTKKKSKDFLIHGYRI